MSTIETWQERLSTLNEWDEFIPAMQAEITELREALKGEQECNVRLDVDWQRCMKEKSELQAKLSAIEALECVGEVETISASPCGLPCYTLDASAFAI